jgi:hypothetical protein
MTENPEVSEFINKAPDRQKEIMQKLRWLIHDSGAGVREEFKWSRPVFKAQNDIAYFKNAKAYVTLGFFNFLKLHDPDNRLEGTGKDMRHVKIKSMEDIDEKLFRDWFKISGE